MKKAFRTLIFFLASKPPTASKKRGRPTKQKAPSPEPKALIPEPETPTPEPTPVKKKRGRPTKQKGKPKSPTPAKKGECSTKSKVFLIFQQIIYI